MMLEVDGVTVAGTSSGKVPLFSPVSFSAPAESVTVIGGPSGVGKTTLLNAIVGLSTLLSGDVRLFGDTSVRTLRTGSRQRLLRSRMAYVGQGLDAIPGLTVDNYLEFNQRLCGRDSNVDDRRSMLASVGLDQHQGAQLDTLSKGQLQRALLCGGFIRRPDLLILDEPTSALDRASRDSVLAMTERLASSGAAVVMVSHDVDVQRKFSRLVSIDAVEVDDA